MKQQHFPPLTNSLSKISLEFVTWIAATRHQVSSWPATKCGRRSTQQILLSTAPGPSAMVKANKSGVNGRDQCYLWPRQVQTNLAEVMWHYIQHLSFASQAGRLYKQEWSPKSICYSLGYPLPSLQLLPHQKKKKKKRFFNLDNTTGLNSLSIWLAVYLASIKLFWHKQNYLWKKDILPLMLLVILPKDCRILVTFW